MYVSISICTTFHSSSSLEKLFTKLRTWYMERDDEASKWAVAYTYEAVNRHNPDRLKAHAAQGPCLHIHNEA